MIFIDNLPYLYTNDHQKEVKGYIPTYLRTAVFTTGILLKILFNSKQTLTKTNKNLLKSALDISAYKFRKNMIPPGSCVGVMAAQSVGEPMTQMMLDAIHGASSGASAGLEKSKEILSGKFPSNQTNSMWFTLCEPHSSDRVYTNNIAELIKGVKLSDFMNAYQVFLEDYGNPVHSLYKHEKKLITEFGKRNPSIKKVINKLSRWVIRLELDKLRLMYKSITIEKIVEKLYLQFQNFVIVYTFEEDVDAIIRIYIKESEFIKITNPKAYVESLIKSVENLLIRGVRNILDTKVQPIRIKYKNDIGDYVGREEYLIRTTGLDMYNISYMADQFRINIDTIHLASVMDTFEYFGIEAARARIIEQMISIMEGNSPTYHHLSIYADIVTWSGRVKAIERAVRSEKNKTLSMASGYSAGKILMSAAAQGVKESTSGVTAPIMLGTIPRVGTNYCTLLINEKFVKKHSKSPEEIIKSL